jgi:O-antigen ligase
MFATGVICFCLPLLAQQGRTIKSTLSLILPSLVICFFSYSRNQILGILAAAVFAIFMAGVSGSLGRLTRKLVAISVVTVSIFLGALFVETMVSNSNWFGRQVAAYSARVIEGLAPNAREADSSLNDREQENSYMLHAIAEEPITGTGYGYMYKPPLGNPGDFAASPEGRMYGHNFYLWTLMKGGPLALLSFVAMLALAVNMVFRYRDSYLIRGAGATVVAFAVTSAVAPMPVGAPGAMLFGIAIGTACGIACDIESARIGVPPALAAAGSRRD